MADRKKMVGNWTEQEVVSNYELREAQLLQAQTIPQLRVALQQLTDHAAGGQNLLQMYTLAGPARIVSLVLRGYEFPDATARSLSTEALLDVHALLERVDRDGQLSEQIWLILAAQHDVLLQQIENDLEALYQADETNVITKQRALLAQAHKVLRAGTKAVLEGMSFASSGAPVPLSFEQNA